MKHRVSLDALTPDWDYTASLPTARTQLRRLVSMRHIRRAPNFKLLEERDTATGRWIAQFFYCPTGELTASQHFTLARIKACNDHKLIICASPSPNLTPKSLEGCADLLYWKSLRGFDFSAYAIALRELSVRASGSDVTLMNDSVFGPFVPFEDLWHGAHWDLSGFTAASTWENHLQSYALQIRGITPDRLSRLRPVFRDRTAFDHYAGVVLNQETRLGAVAARSMSVGARWFEGAEQKFDPSLHAALSLLEAGFPFLKKALFTKHEGIERLSDLKAALIKRGHPVEF